MTFIDITQLDYQGTCANEHIWKVRDTSASTYTLAGSLLGGEVIRMRLLRNTALEGTRYQLADGGPGTLPYHSWIVAKGDEQWPDFASNSQARAMLEPYIQSFAFSEHTLRLTRPLASKEHIYGLGERTGSMDKRGQAFPIWNVDPEIGHDAHTVTMYTSIPFYLAVRRDTNHASGVLIDATGKIDMDIGKTQENQLSVTVEGDSLIVYFLAGPKPQDIIRQYTELTGRITLPPRWALGHHQCRWSYKSEQEVREIVTNYRTHTIPCDAIWLDIDYMNGFRNFTWNPQTFPQPEKMLSDLHQQGFHLITIIDPGTKIDENYPVYQQGIEQNYFCRYENGELFTGSVWPGSCVFPDFSQTRVRAWWGNLYQTLLDQGVDGFWNDMDEPAIIPGDKSEAEVDIEQKVIESVQQAYQQADEKDVLSWDKTMAPDVLHVAGGDQPTGPDGPPVLHKYYHNAYGMEMARATYEGLLRLRPDARPFVLTRSGTAGVQRYAAIWTGDNWSRWEDILMAIPMCLNLGMSGVPFVGVDIGGFWHDSNGELLVRFAQLGAFLPFCRNHSAADTVSQEPWAFGEPYESAYRTAIETRYRLMPYLYTLFHEAATTGAPIIRPLYYYYGEDEQACEVEDAFLVGDRLLSAPLYEQGATQRRVYLPQGHWFDYWTGKEYAGGGWSDIDAPLEKWPLFVKGNTILPSGPVMQYVGQKATDPLTFTVYMATDGVSSYRHYEDDGSTLGYKQGQFAEVIVNCSVQADEVTVEIEERFHGYQPQREHYELVVHVGGRTFTKTLAAGQGRVVERF